MFGSCRYSKPFLTFCPKLIPLIATSAIAVRISCFMGFNFLVVDLFSRFMPKYLFEIIAIDLQVTHDNQLRKLLIFIPDLSEPQMKINIKENGINIADLRAELQEAFSGKYEIKNRGPKMLVVAKSNIIGVTILPRKKSLIVNGNFSTMGAQMIFVLVLLLLGFLIPLIIYFAVFHKEMKAIEREVCDFIKEKYIEHLA